MSNPSFHVQIQNQETTVTKVGEWQKSESSGHESSICRFVPLLKTDLNYH